MSAAAMAVSSIPFHSAHNAGTRYGEGDRKRIGTILVEACAVTEGQLREALRFQMDKGGKLAEILIGLGYLKSSQLSSVLAKQPGVASIELSNYCISKELLALIPRAYAEEKEIFPMDRMGRQLTVGMVCPLDATTIKELTEMTGLRIRPLLCCKEAIQDAIRRYYRHEESSYYDGVSLKYALHGG